MRFSNARMSVMFESAKAFLGRKDIIGYACARNVRVLGNELTEYTRARNDLIEKYGKDVTDSDGNKTGQYSISVNSPSFVDFASELDKFSNIEHEVDIFKIGYDNVVGELSGEEILSIDWMLEDTQ